MIKNALLLKKFNEDFIKNKKLSYKKAMKIYEALWNEARNFSVLPRKNYFQSLDIDIKIAGIINYKVKKNV
ncbi:MAG: hypothetical protein HY919_08800 [Elusimicrobia bacterium]|nr:hypothetical protein [Elusimicrobiota bacterium]